MIKIAIIRASSIGDVVLASACLSWLKSLELESQVLWVGQKPTLKLLQAAYPDLDVLDLKANRSLADMVKQLESYDLIVDLQTSLRSIFLCLLFRLKYGRPSYFTKKNYFRRGFSILRATLFGRLAQFHNKSSNVLYQYRSMLDTAYRALSDANVNNELINKLSLSRAYPSLPFSPEEQSVHLQIFQGHDVKFWLAVAPGASFETKRASVEIFCGIILELKQLLSQKTRSSEGQFGLVLLGSEADEAPCDKIAKQLDWSGPVLNLVGALDLEDVRIVLAKCSALLSNDSGLAHIAEAVATPTAVLYGPTVESYGFAPWMQESKAFSAPLGCRPCSKHGKRTCRYQDKACFEGIEIKAVAKHLSSLLDIGPNCC